MVIAVKKLFITTAEGRKYGLKSLYIQIIAKERKI
jgi:hypothetical protein